MNGFSIVNLRSRNSLRYSTDRQNESIEDFRYKFIGSRSIIQLAAARRKTLTSCRNSHLAFGPFEITLDLNRIRFSVLLDQGTAIGGKNTD